MIENKEKTLVNEFKKLAQQKNLLEVRESFGKKLKDIASESILDTTSHGLPKIIKNKNICLQMLWIFALMASSGGCAYLMYDTLSHYLQWSVVTNIKVVSETPARFPTVLAYFFL
jgi:hypothetical protein